MSTPTSRTLEALRKQGYEADVVERFNSFTKQRKDFYGCIDLIATKPGECIGVQCTSGSNAASRVTKILAEPRALSWLQAGNKLQVWGWAKRGPKGKRKLWSTSIKEITETDFQDQPHE